MAATKPEECRLSPPPTFLVDVLHLKIPAPPVSDAGDVAALRPPRKSDYIFRKEVDSSANKSSTITQPSASLNAALASLSSVIRQVNTERALLCIICAVIFTRPQAHQQTADTGRLVS